MNKNLIKLFNKNRNKESYEEILNDYFPNNDKCRICGKVIYYYDSSFIFNKKLKLIGKSYKSNKELFGKIYFLSVCENCLIDKFPEYNVLNKSRVFNRLNPITNYAYDIPEDISKMWRKENYAITKENLIKKYGEDDGLKRWLKYCDIQSKTNSFEYKKDKYGWNINNFKDYNKSRSVTLDNMIKKYGKDIGVEKWKQYVNKQILTKSKEYFVSLYGIDKWLELNKQKTLNLDNFIRKYGKEEGSVRFQDYLDKRICLPASKSSQKYFKILDKLLNDEYKLYYFDKNGKEFSKLLSNGRYVYLDFYIKELNLNIEFNGDLFHANPKLFKDDDKPNFLIDLTSKQIWEKDKEKLNLLKKDHNIDTIVIWEHELPEPSELVKIIKQYDRDRI